MNSQKPIKVLIAAGIYPPDPGGPALHAKKQFESLPDLGIETSLVALAHLRKFPAGVRHLLFLIKLIRKAWGSDIIYAHDALGVGLPALSASKILGKKLILRIGGDLAWERAAEKKGISMMEWYRSGEYKENANYHRTKKVIREADLIIVPSKILKDAYVSYYGASEDKVAIILNPVPAATGVVVSTEKSMLFASRLASYKNLDLVLEAVSPILKNDKDLKLVILGNGPEESSLKAASKNLKIEDQVEFAGLVSQEEVLKRTAACLFTIAPALTEFNPNYVLQGISLGKPFIISWENGLPFEVPEFMRFNSRSKEDLREKVSNILSTDGYTKARDFISRIELTSTWETNLSENADLIRGLLNGSK